MPTLELSNVEFVLLLQDKKGYTMKMEGETLVGTQKYKGLL